MNYSNQKTYLALGDSYTIGESLPVYESFPYQTVQLLRKAAHHFNAAEIIAKTGWTTDELQKAINDTVFQSSYDFVSLLIGVNNQYRERSPSEYSIEFENLLQQAIQLADKNINHVFVLSIPDWGVTPFAEGRNRVSISKAIDSYNQHNKGITQKYGCQYIDISESTGEAISNESLLAADKLHPSAKEYARWAGKLCSLIIKEL
jgi:lysophospholipase L1-like esterase